MSEDLDTLVRRVDEDRWLATRFAPPRVRARLIALYAVNYEIARTADTVREAPIGDIRLEWWRSALVGVSSGEPHRAQPALEELARVLKRPSDADALQPIVSARAADFDLQPFETWEDLEAYIDATAGALISACIAQCEAQGAVAPVFIEAAGRAWGYTGLLRAGAFWTAKGRSALPRKGGDVAEMKSRAQRAYATARAQSKAQPQELFPAIGYLRFVPGYLRALERGQSERPLAVRQFALIAASATGQL